MDKKFNTNRFIMYLASALFVAGIQFNKPDLLISVYSPYWEFSVGTMLIAFVAYSITWLIWIKFFGTFNAQSYWWLCVSGSLLRLIFHGLFAGILTDPAIWDLVLFIIIPIGSILFSILIFVISYPLQILVEQFVGPEKL